MPEFFFTQEQLGQPFAHGAYKQVFNYPGDDSKIIALDQHAGFSGKFNTEYHPDYMKVTYYFGNLCHVLFPEHFPKAHFAVTKTGLPSQSIKERIIATNQQEYTERQALKAAEIINEKLASAGYESYVDMKRQNYIIKNNSPVYVDTLRPINAFPVEMQKADGSWIEDKEGWSLLFLKQTPVQKGKPLSVIDDLKFTQYLEFLGQRANTNLHKNKIRLAHFFFQIH